MDHNVHRGLYGPTAGLVLQLLASYESRVRELLTVGMEPALYADAATLFDSLRFQVAALPEGRFAWIEVLISRFEFTGALWDAHGGEDQARQLHERAGKHLRALERFRAECQAAYPEATAAPIAAQRHGAAGTVAPD